MKVTLNGYVQYTGSPCKVLLINLIDYMTAALIDEKHSRVEELTNLLCSDRMT